MKTTACLIIFFLILTGFPVLADEINVVRWATPEWEGYTNQDGTGLYNEIIGKIFGLDAIQIERIYVPWKRALDLVAHGDADMTGALEPTTKFIQPKYPIVVSQEYVLFKQTTFKQWEGLLSLKGKSGVWYLGYTDAMPEEVKQILKGYGSPAREAALKMLIAGRVDYYLDNLTQMRQTISTATVAFDMREYRMESIEDPILTEYLYMCFSNTDRGKQLKDLYEKRIEQLYQLGELQAFYEKWKRPLPILNIEQDRK